MSSPVSSEGDDTSSASGAIAVDCHNGPCSEVIVTGRNVKSVSSTGISSYVNMNTVSDNGF